MSSIGSGSPIGPLASSTAGIAGQQRIAGAAAQAGEAAERKFQQDLKAQSEKAVGDIGESDSTGERDADGRLPWQIHRGQNSGGGDPNAKPAADPDGDLGGQLDFSA